MTPSDDLAGRIARLERLLESLERSRLGERGKPDSRAVAAATDRIREVMQMLDGRRRQSRVDGADALAMRTLLEEFRSLTDELRTQAARLHQRLEAALTDLRQVHQRLNDDGNV